MSPVFLLERLVIYMKRVYALYRVSTKGQVDKNDIPMQRQACTEFVGVHPDWKLVKEFQEQGVSGFKVSAKDRDAIQEIQRDAIENRFDILLVFMFDRIGRREDETPFVVEWFVKHDIEVWSVCEGQQRFDTHVDKLMNYIRYWQASGESIKTSIRVKTRMGQLVQEGRHKGGNPAFGYKLMKLGRLNKKGQEVSDIVINEDEAAVVRLIFDRYANAGYGTHQVATYLTDRGIINRAGSNFISSSIANILKNPMYTGVLRSGEIFSEPYEHLQIIDQDTFDRARELARQRSAKYKENCSLPKSVVSPSLLTGSIYCAHCGSRLMSSTAGRSKTDENGDTQIYRYWRYLCHNRMHHKHLCDGQTGYQSHIIDEIVEGILLDMFAKIKRVSQSELLDKQYQTEVNERKSRLARMEKTLTKHTNDIGILNGEIASAITGQSKFTPDTLQKALEETAQKLQECSDEVATLTAELHESESIFESLKEKNNQLLSWADVYAESEPEVKKMIAAHLIQKVTVGRGYEIDIEFSISIKQYLEFYDEDRKSA
jgi:DNA invertase Pin-like site-specific DNA recombinase